MPSINNQHLINPSDINDVSKIRLNYIDNTEGIKTNNKSFKEVLNSNEISLEKTLIQSIGALDQSFRGTEAKTAALTKSVPKEYQALFELQLSVYKCNFQTEIVTKVGEAVQGAVKKLQNQAANLC